jgi:uncharacterized protein
MHVYRMPGVYFEWADEAAAAGSRRTDIAGFAGIAAQGPLHRPVKVASWTQFRSLFGGHLAQGYLAYAVEGFFANGGRTCWVVRVADPGAARCATLTLVDELGAETLLLRARSPGRWAHRLRVGLLRTGTERFALALAHPDGGQEVWSDLTMAVARADIPGSAQGVRSLLRILVRDPELANQPPDPQRSRARLFAQVSGSDGGRFTLALRVDDKERDAWGDLSMDPRDPRYVETVVNVPQNGFNLFTVKDFSRVGSAGGRNAPVPGLWPFEAEPRYVAAVLNDPTGGSRWVEAEHLPSQSPFPRDTPDAGGANSGAGFGGGADGLGQLTIAHLLDRGPWPSGCRGLACLESIEEVAILALPDLMPKPRVSAVYCPSPPVDCARLDVRASVPDRDQETEWPASFSDAQIAEVQRAMVEQCERLRDRVAILDCPPSCTTVEQVIGWRQRFDTSWGALYFPWVSVPDPLLPAGALRRVPPSGHVAGVYARGDLAVGVHRPPANQVLDGVQAVAQGIDDAWHARLNDYQINAIRALGARGVRILGARTLSSDPGLRYINVRRLLAMLGEALDEQVQGLVFEPNTESLWGAIERTTRGVLDGLWRRGMLDGATAAEAYRLRCDAETNPPDQRAVGRVICEIQLNPPAPAELLVVRIGFTEAGVTLIETGG